jgi:hypothetical protein
MMHKIWDGPQEKVRFWLEISVKYSDKFTLLGVVRQQSLLQCTSLITFPAASDLIFHVLAFVSPKFALKLHQILFIVHTTYMIYL